jgi:four helix bundle protein
MVAVKRYEDLIAWRLSVDLGKAVGEIVARPAVARDCRFCQQLRDSVASAARNIAEGFGRYQPRDHGHFLDIAYASLMEAKNNLQDARSRGYLNEEEFTRLIRLTIRASKGKCQIFCV